MSHSHKQILPGIKPVLECLERAPANILKVVCKKNPAWAQAKKLEGLCQKQGVPLEYADSARLDVLCADARHVAHQGVVAILAEASLVTLADLLRNCRGAPLPLLLALDQIKDPGNAGSICRLAWALGCGGLIVPKHNSAALGPAAAKTSAGALALLPICEVVNLARALDEAEEAGFAIYGAQSGAGSVNAFAFAWQLPATLVLGAEAGGIRPGVAKRCSQMLEIPLQRGFDSLNVAQAGAILTALCARALFAGTASLSD